MFTIFVHNQCSDFELVSPVYFGYNTIWLRYPNQKVDINTTIEISFGRDVSKDEFAGALIYKLRKRRCFEFNDQSNVNSALTEDTPTSIQLLIMWRFNNKSEVSLCAQLIKHSNVITWNEYILENLYSTHLGLLRDDRVVKDTWRLDDATVLMTTSRWEMSSTIDITISEGTREYGSMEPIWVPSSI
jgi:hypothetical protein